MKTETGIKIESEIIEDYCRAEISKTGIKILGGWLETEKALEFGLALTDMARKQIIEKSVGAK